MKKMTYSILAFIVAVALFIPSVCHADSAEVLPKGVYSFDTTYYHYFDITKRYNPDGDVEDIAVDYNTELNSSVFPALAALDPFVGTASIGRSVVDFKLLYRWFEFSLSRGLTDRLSIGVLVPFNYSKNEVNARLDAATANVGKNAAFACGAPLCPLIIPGTVPLTTEDVQNLLGNGLDVNGDGATDIDGFGFKQVETWSETGIGDIELLTKYRFLNSEKWRLAITGGLRLPTGEVDDPDNLVDVPFGDGQTDLLFRFHTDYKGVEKLLLNTTLRYDLQLPDKEEKRVPDDVNLPLTDNKEKVDRNLGDVIDLELMGNYSFTQQFSGGVKYRFTKKFKDDVTGNQGFAYSSLEDETDSTSHMAFVTLGYSTIQKYLDRKFPIPLSANVAYRNRFAGTNNVTNSQFVSLNFSVYFN